jgi:hypothetical protein
VSGGLTGKHPRDDRDDVVAVLDALQRAVGPDHQPAVAQLRAFLLVADHRADRAHFAAVMMFATRFVALVPGALLEFEQQVLGVRQDLEAFTRGRGR